MHIADIKQIHIQRLLNDISGEYSVKTIKNIRGIITSMFGKAVANGLIPYNPTVRLEASGKEPKRRRELTADERVKYLEACKQHPFGEYAAVLYFFGLRKGEALALRSEDLLADAIHITRQITYPGQNEPVIGLPKTKAGVRYVAIPDAAREYIDFSDNRGILFPGASKEGYMLESQITQQWRSFITYALGEDTDITQHCLRHNYCTMLFEIGLDIVAVQVLMGHDDTDTTMRIYAHFTDKIKLNGLEAVKGLSSQPAAPEVREKQ